MATVVLVVVDIVVNVVLALFFVTDHIILYLVVVNKCFYEAPIGC